MILFHDMVIGVTGFMVTVFFLGFAISPLWTATMDIAPGYAGTSSSLMNASGASNPERVFRQYEWLR